MKWTPENDQLLLLKILETSNLNADVKAISAAWPTTGETPTPRAITERLVAIRKAAKSNGGGHFSVSSSQTKSSPSKPASTPRKPRTTKKAIPPEKTETEEGKSNSSNGKRKRDTASSSTVTIKKEENPDPEADNDVDDTDDGIEDENSLTQHTVKKFQCEGTPNPLFTAFPDLYPHGQELGVEEDGMDGGYVSSMSEY